MGSLTPEDLFAEDSYATVAPARPGPSSDSAPAQGAEAPTVSHLPAPASPVSESANLSTRVSLFPPPALPLDDSTDWPAVPGYEILAELGRGGMGVVYKARQLRLKRLVALKMILSGAHAQGEDKARFRAEAEAVASLQHPNIIQIYEVGEDVGRPFFSLEFVEGGSLDKKLAGTPLPARAAAQLIEALARAMEAAHLCGIVHRDLKPANVLLTGAPEAPVERCTPKITDFGLAKQLGVESGRTQSGAIMGTPCYMAPEQAAGKAREVGPLSDVYALGAMLYECLTGRPPFKGSTLMETLEQVRNADPVPPGRLQPRVPRDLETICLKCLEKAPQGRYASALALADDLKRFLDGEPIRARRVRFWEHAGKWARRRPTAAALVVVLAVVGLALPIAAWQFSAQLAERREMEQQRLSDARAEVNDLRARGQTATLSQDWKQAEGLLEKALGKIDAEPALADLRADVESARAPVKERLAALDIYRRFVRDRDEALFHATLAGGENFRTNRTTARERASAALALVGLAADGQGALNLRSVTEKEKTDIVSGCYALLMMLAETEARPVPGQPAAEHPQCLRQALALLDRADELGVRGRAIHLRRARYLDMLGDGAGAARENGRAVALTAETKLDALDHFLVGHELYSQGQLERANKELRQALRLNPQHFWTHYFLGICCVTNGKPEQAVVHFTICRGQQPTLVWAYLLRGFALGQMEDYAAAEADFDAALTLRPSAATLYVLYNNRGVMRVGWPGTRAKGMEDLKQAIALRPDQYQARVSLAEACRLGGQLDEARKHLDEAIAVAGRQVRTRDVRPATLALLYHSRARLHLERSEREAALRDLSEASKLAADDAPLRARAEADRGRVLHLRQDFDEALAAYESALKAAPERVVVRRWQGEVFLAQKRYSKAAAAFDAYLKNGGAPSAAVYRERGLARAKLGRHAEAIEDYSRGLEVGAKDEEQGSLHLYRGQEYLALNALQPALRDFEAAQQMSPTSADAHLGCAHVRVRLGDIRRSVGDAEKAVKGEPKEPRLWHGAARIYAQAIAKLTGEPDEGRLRGRYRERALVLLRKALVLVPAKERQAYWRDKLLKDEALGSIRADLVGLGERSGARDR